ncbi:MAG: DUF2853 family protein [Novosphingobium sp.]
MATDWAADVKKYAKSADDAIIAGIVRYCGIALTKVDSSLVAFSDKKELDRVRNNFLKKKLGRTEADSVLDAAIAKVGETMKADRTKNRVTVYYLLADHYKSLPLFAPKAKADAAKAPAKEVAPKAAAAKTAKPAAKSAGKAAAAVAGAAAVAAAAKKPAAKKAAAPAKAPAAKAAPAKKAAAPAKKAGAPAAKKAPAAKAAAATVAAGGALGLASAAAAAAKPVAAPTPAPAPVEPAKVAAAAVAAGAATVATAASAAPKAAAPVAAREEASGLGWLWWLLGLAALLFLAWYFFLRGPAEPAATTGATTEQSSAATTEGSAGAVDLTAAPAEGTVTIPTGAGVTVENRETKPVVKVYFDSGKVDVAPAFDPAAGGLKAWLAANPGSTLAISGYADPSGNAALNAELAKKRAQAVQAALVKAGVPEASALLVKPDSVTDATVAKDAARRVEVVVK